MANRNPVSKSVTIDNLGAAFAGEPMAHIKYRYFAKLAREAGAEEIAKIFEEIAEWNEHATNFRRTLEPAAKRFAALAQVEERHANRYRETLATVAA